jgi:S-(hydroxymethyl)glutathione dehydrogenase / alcohol dehydrogenase
MTGPASGLAAIGDGAGQFTLDTVEVAAPSRGEVRVRLLAAGICHTDHASLSWPGPLVLGHEGAGVVEAVGAGVTLFRTGQRVLLNWAIPCGQCPQCTRGRGSLCERTHGVGNTPGSSRAAPGHTRWRGQAIERSFNLGTFSEYTVVRAEALTVLPDDMAAEQACILGCGVMTGVGAVLNVAAVQPGESVAVLGCGGVGLSVIQGARLAGATTIIAIDRREQALARARELGATHAVPALADDVAHDQLVARVRALSQGRGVDHAFEATAVPALAFLPLRLVRNGGNAIQLSGSHGHAAVHLPDLMWDKRYQSPLYGGCLPERDFPRLVDWAQRGELQLGQMVTHRYSLPQLQRALEDMLSGASAKGVILFEEAP